MAFADNLKNLPSAAHLAAIDLLDAAGECVATIENKPGQAGSLTLYAAMAAKHGAITPAAAQEARQGLGVHGLEHLHEPKDALEVLFMHHRFDAMTTWPPPLRR